MRRSGRTIVAHLRMTREKEQSMRTGPGKWREWLTGGIAQPPSFDVIAAAQARISRHTVLIGPRELVQKIRTGGDLKPGSGVLVQFMSSHAIFLRKILGQGGARADSSCAVRSPSC